MLSLRWKKMLGWRIKILARGNCSKQIFLICFIALCCCKGVAENGLSLSAKIPSKAFSSSLRVLLLSSPVKDEQSQGPGRDGQGPFSVEQTMFSNTIALGGKERSFLEEGGDCSKSKDNVLKQGDNVLMSEVDSLPIPTLRITEIMHRPGSNQSFFIEIFNAGIEPIPLHLCGISLRKKGNLTSFAPLVSRDEEVWLSSGAYAVLVPDKEYFIRLYQLLPYRVIQPSKFPSLPAKAGNIVLSLGTKENIVEEVFYDETFYPKELGKETGVSLKRIDPFARSMDKTNWRISFHPTPGEENTAEILEEEELWKWMQSRAVRSVTELASEVLSLNKEQFPHIVTFLYDMAGHWLGIMNRDQTESWCKNVAKDGNFSLQEVFPIGAEPCLVVVHLQSKEGHNYTLCALVHFMS